MQRSVNLILGTGKMKTKPGQNTNEFNCVDSMTPLIWTSVTEDIFHITQYFFRALSD
jgi:hypothetical protein